MKRNELETLWQDIIEGFTEAVEEAKAMKEANKPTTVEELDASIPDIPNLEPEQIVLPKPEAVANQCLDIIGNTLKQRLPINESQVDTMLKLAELRLRVLCCDT